LYEKAKINEKEAGVGLLKNCRVNTMI